MILEFTDSARLLIVHPVHVYVTLKIKQFASFYSKAPVSTNQVFFTEYHCIPDILFIPEEDVCYILLFGSQNHSDNINKTILNATIRFIRTTLWTEVEAYQIIN